ncbi:hypothetical protein QUB80_14640 [Chlorogloeopsis sp. ULAP01]|uniref:hypothetical protein n=1 Tax=Chlorogloeopsis sp. ULAP01 TaxID=3056483 RepID=UPI0025AA7B55|nr:hypothetical protein [Chlorogloeopsis sp. ULAP01]MDM9381940.1 hypothetical protein [Chlorogloeopsis sp. ULAP01]
MVKLNYRTLLAVMKLSLRWIVIALCSLVLSLQIHLLTPVYAQPQSQMGRLLENKREQETGLGEQFSNQQAIAYYTQAIKVLQSLRGDLVALNPDIQFSFRESVEPVYRELVDLLLQEPQPSTENLIQTRN